MADWFAPKRYGWGARPASWQGWLVTLAYCLLIFGAAQLAHRSKLAAAALIVPATGVFLLVVINNTRGGWRWRWGRGD